MDAADGEGTWVEGSVDGEAAHHIDKQEEGATNKRFEILCKFEPDHRMLPQASDWAESGFARGAVQVMPSLRIRKATTPQAGVS